MKDFSDKRPIAIIDTVHALQKTFFETWSFLINVYKNADDWGLREHICPPINPHLPLA